MRLRDILTRCFQPKQNEEVLIITDYFKKQLAEKFFNEFRKITDNVNLLVMKPTTKHGEEPSILVADAMYNSDIFLAITEYSLTHTEARKKATQEGKSRGATMPGFVEKMFNSLKANPFELKELGNRIQKVLKKTKEIRITTSSGTDISFELEKKRRIEIDDGIYTNPGTFGNLPAGEVYLAPKEGTCNGTLIIDDMKNGKTIFAPQRTKITIKDGEAKHVSRKCMLKNYFDTVKNARNVAEFGIGTNKKAKVIGYILQDEKAFGTCHIAFGDNTSFGGKVSSQVHIDAVLLKPTIYTDEKFLMKDGRLILD